MADFTVAIDDADVADVIAALCKHYNYQAQVTNESYDPNLPAEGDNTEMIDNPETTFQFANRMTRKFLTDHTTKYRKDQALAAVQDPSAPTITDPAV